jgi:hypothetical protein
MKEACLGAYLPNGGVTVGSASDAVVFLHLRHHLRIRQLVRALDRNNALGRSPGSTETLVELQLRLTWPKEQVTHGTPLRPVVLDGRNAPSTAATWLGRMARLSQNPLSRIAHMGRARPHHTPHAPARLSAVACPEQHSLHQRTPASLRTVPRTGCWRDRRDGLRCPLAACCHARARSPSAESQRLTARLGRISGK